LVEPACSPTENIALDSRAEIVPVRRNSFTAVQCSASAFDLACPSLVDILTITIIQAFE